MERQLELENLQVITTPHWFEEDARAYNVPVGRLAKEMEIVADSLSTMNGITNPLDLANHYGMLPVYAKDWSEYFQRDAKDIVRLSVPRAIRSYVRGFNNAGHTHQNQHHHYPLVIGMGGSYGLNGATTEAMLSYRGVVDPDDQRVLSDRTTIKRQEWRYESHLKSLALNQEHRQELRQKLKEVSERMIDKPEPYLIEEYGRTYDKLLASEIASRGLESLGIDNQEIENHEALFAQLDWEMLPPGINLEEVAKTDAERMKIGGTSIDTNRLDLLTSIAKTEGLSVDLYRSRMGLRQEPYYAAVIEIDNTKVIVGESPVLANATYVVREDLTPGTWQEVMSIQKAEARDLGAVRVIHPDEDDPSKYSTHRENVMTRLDLMLKVQPL